MFICHVLSFEKRSMRLIETFLAAFAAKSRIIWLITLPSTLYCKPYCRLIFVKKRKWSRFVLLLVLGWSIWPWSF
jgi:hypothetical protein